MIDEEVKQKRRLCIEYETHGGYRNGVIGMRETGNKTIETTKTDGTIDFFIRGGVFSSDSKSGEGRLSVGRWL